MIEHYSHKIQNAIQKELFKANSSIKIAVAWFTNDLLFQPLLLKLGAGVSVELILNKDEINCSEDNEIDFDEFVYGGGILRWNETKQLLHDKFCIIDDNIVIYGSYNWTNKAEYNEESIAISKDEESTTQFYLDKFEKLSIKYPKIEKEKIKDPAKVESHEFVTDEIRLVETAIKNGGFPTECLMPSVYKACEPDSTTSYLEKHPFYDDVNLFYAHIIAKGGDSFYFLDNKTFLPINDVEFTNFKIFGETNLTLLWLEVNGKWGIYDTDAKMFVLPAIFDSFEKRSGGEFGIFIKERCWRINRNGELHYNLDF